MENNLNSALPNISDLLNEPWEQSFRHETYEVQIGNIRIGGNTSIAIQDFFDLVAHFEYHTIKQFFHLTCVV